MIVYAESSAVLSWLLGEPPGPAVRSVLEAAAFVVTSDLTFVECDRALHHARSLGQLSGEFSAELSSELRRIAAGWIRSLDALHLASALATMALIPETTILTLDERVRRCGHRLGLTVLPTSV